MDGIHRNAVVGLAVFVIIWNQDVHVGAIDETSLSNGDHARLLRLIVPRPQYSRGIGLDCDGCPNLMRE